MTTPELTKVEYPEPWLDLHIRFADNIRGVKSEQLADSGSLIFTDVIPPEGLGTDFFYNTPASVSQLLVALSVAPSADIGDLFNRFNRESRATSLQDLTQEMRSRRVLSGFKLLDLGCGVVPGLGVAAKSLGAEVHTVDGESLDTSYAPYVDTHTTIDLFSSEALDTIRANTGGQFDYITECIIGNVPGHPSWKTPDEGDLQFFGEQLLKVGGYQYHAGSNLLQKA